MIKEFALDPVVPAQSFDKCRYFLEAIRIENGRLLSCFPGKWKKMVYDSAQALHGGKIELSRIEVCLRERSNGSLFSCGRPGGDGTASWLQRAVAEHARLPFAAIIALDVQPGTDFVIAADEVDTNIAFQSSGQGQIVRRSAEIVECVALLLRVAGTVKLIDPHFKASAPRWRRGLERLVGIVPNGSTIEIHRQDGEELPANQRGWFDRDIPRILGNGVTIKIFLHPKAMMHNRYILTEQGGASFGTGLDDHEDGDEGVTDDDDVVLLREDMRKEKWNKYQHTSPFLTYSGQR